MLNFCIGLMIIMVLASISRKKFEAKGWIGVGLFIAMCYGIGYAMGQIISFVSYLIGR